MPLLGYVAPKDRTQSQEAAHAAAVAGMRPARAYGLPAPQLAAGEAVRLFDAWKHPAVVADVGFAFTRFRQLTGSCVGVGGGCASFSTIATQRLLPAPTKAFLPFWPGPYAMSRHYMGDDGPGEGSMGSTFAKALVTDGLRDWPDGKEGLPDYSTGNGIAITEREELLWSSTRNSALQPVLAVSRQHLFGSAAPCETVADIRAMILNGYGVTFACNNYIGAARVQGDVVVGRWDSYGPHQQSIHAVWEHPVLGPLFWAQNTWDEGQYPRDPAGGPACGCWVKEADVAAALRLDAEVYGLSHLDWFPAQPDTPTVLRWMI